MSAARDLAKLIIDLERDTEGTIEESDGFLVPPETWAQMVALSRQVQTQPQVTLQLGRTPQLVVNCERCAANHVATPCELIEDAQGPFYGRPVCATCYLHLSGRLL